MTDVRLMSVGAVGAVALVAALWTLNRFDEQRVLIPTKSLQAHEDGRRSDQTVEQWLGERHPDGQWIVVDGAASARVVFEADGARYAWTATHDEIVFVRTANEQAEALTPGHLPLQRMLETARETY